MPDAEVVAAAGGPPAGHLVVITGLPGSGKTTLATALARRHGAARMCPDDWMMSAGIDLWDAAARASIEALQFELALDLLRRGRTVIIEWGVWTRSERDQLRDGARAHGATVELCYVDAPLDELWRRIVDRDLEGRWSDRSIERHEVAAWATAFEPPTDDERASYDLDTLDE